MCEKVRKQYKVDMRNLYEKHEKENCIDYKEFWGLSDYNRKDEKKKRIKTNMQHRKNIEKKKRENKESKVEEFGGMTTWKRKR